MKQFSKILKFELKYYLKNKVFVGITVFLVLLIAAVMCFPRIVEIFEKKDLTQDNLEQEDFAQEGEKLGESPVMLIKTGDQELEEMIKESFAATFASYELVFTEEDVTAIKEQITAENAECAFVLNDATTYTYYVNNLSMYDGNPQIANEVLQNLYQMKAMVSGGMTPKQATEVMNIQITGAVESLGKDQMENFFYTYIMIFALYMVILLYGQMVSTNVATEKSSRAMEVLITSAKPTAMMFGKVLASCLAGLIQLVAVFGSALLFYGLNQSYWGENEIVKSFFNIPPELFVYMLIFFVLGFLIYAFLFGAIGSTANKLEDINTSTMPLMVLFIIAFMVVMFSMSSGPMMPSSAMAAMVSSGAILSTA